MEKREQAIMYSEDEKLRDFAGKEYYMKAWGKRVSFNFAAMFLSLVWLAYRKMYLYAFLGLAVYSVLHFGVLYALPDLFSAYDYFIGTVLIVVFGFFGNLIYLRFAKSKIAEIEKGQADPAGQKRQIQAAGGTDRRTAIIIGIVWAALLGFVYGEFYGLWDISLSDI